MESKFDTIVIGGGTAGAVAALASARKGAKTLLVEGSGKLGGLAATGMTWGGFFDGGHRQVIRGIPDELVGKALASGSGRGYIHYHGEDRWISALASVDPTFYRYLIHNELSQAGCRVLLYTRLLNVRVKQDRVERVAVLNKHGVHELQAKTFIDATGDADLANLAGVEWEGDEGGKRQCLTRIFRISNVDFPQLEGFMQNELNDEGRIPWKIETASMRAAFRYWCPWRRDDSLNRSGSGAEGGAGSCSGSMPKLFGVYWHGFPGDLYVNCTSSDVDALEVEAFGQAAKALQDESFRIYRYLKSTVPGFSNSFLTHVYEIGVRASRRILGRYQVTIDDIKNSKSHADTVGFGAYPPDIHSPSGEADIDPAGNVAYEIPYRALVPRSISNLLVAGRSISATFAAQSALRGIGPCLAEGQAAGTAASLAAASKQKAAELSVSELRESLGASGAWLG